MTGPLVECVPNFSEGRDASRTNQIGAAIASVDEVLLLHTHADADHNRCVITFAGPPRRWWMRRFAARERLSSRSICARTQVFTPEWVRSMCFLSSRLGV